MKIKSLSEIVVMIEDVLGKPASDMFEENMDEFVYFVRASALNSPEITESKMRRELRKLSEGILAASVKRFLNDHYADDFGDIEINVNEEGGIYDRNMRPINAIEKIRKCQREMTTLMVSRGMHEFTKGRNLARIMGMRISDSVANEPSPKDAVWISDSKPILERAEIEIMRLEKKLPSLTSSEAAILSALYQKLRDCRKTAQ